jgi:hypothetical protein
MHCPMPFTVAAIVAAAAPAIVTPAEFGRAAQDTVRRGCHDSRSCALRASP